MPSDRFFKLSSEKQKRILQAAEKEFAAAGFQEASINQMIREAEISRGSFYTYFQDKSDIFDCIFARLCEKSSHMILDRVKEADGDIFIAAMELMQEGISVSFNPEDTDMILYHRIMTDYNIISHLKNRVRNGEEITFEKLNVVLKKIYSEMNDLRNYLSYEDFEKIVDMLVTISVKTLVSVRTEPERKQISMDSLAFQYRIIEAGIRGGIK